MSKIVDARIAANEKAEIFFARTNYIRDCPRFRVQGMNQAELLTHIFIAGFMRGAEFKEVKE